MSSNALPVRTRLQRMWRAWTGVDQQELEALQAAHEATWELLNQAVAHWQAKSEELTARLKRAEEQCARANAKLMQADDQLAVNAEALNAAYIFRDEHSVCQKNWEEVLDLLALPRDASMAAVRDVLNPDQIQFGWENHPLVPRYVTLQSITPAEAENVRHLSALIMRLKRLEKRQAQARGLRC